jgi:hypothetical protein
LLRLLDAHAAVLEEFEQHAITLESILDAHAAVLEELEQHAITLLSMLEVQEAVFEPKFQLLWPFDRA